MYRNTSFIVIILFAFTCIASCNDSTKTSTSTPSSEAAVDTALKPKPVLWRAPDTSTLGNSEQEQLIKYGRNLIANTAFYLGPHGSVAKITNGMNCQNCHLDAGTKPFGNNYGGVASTYPKFRDRSNSMEGIYKRVNDCIERSLNGKALDTTSREMQAIKAYLLWLGKDVPKGVKPFGSGIKEVAYLERAADPAKGKEVYIAKCKVCHGDNGAGKPYSTNITYQYPPLWGPHSYNIGAGLYRLSRFAGYAKYNMPFGTNYDNPQLNDEEAWDVAAFVESQQRPGKNTSKDYPVIAKKPTDYPFGPYEDSFTEQQHKYGPFGPIVVEAKRKIQESH